MSNLVGQQISHYQIMALLGTGRIGTVYQAVNLEDLSPVALKIINLPFADKPEIRLRFLQEIRALPRLDHPSIINIFEAGIDTAHDLLYLTMEFVPGRSLSSLLQQFEFNNQLMDVGDVLTVGAQIAEALGYAHQKRMFHRDIRPGVILFKPKDKPDESYNLPGRAAIGDFALQTLVEQEDEPFKPALPYSPPEVFLGREVNGRSDIYSLGVVLFQMVTGRLPFITDSQAEAARQHPYQDPPPPTTVRPDLPPAVEEAILKAMAKSPENRFRDGAEMAASLRQLSERYSQRTAVSDAQASAGYSKTALEPPEILALSQQWSADEDRVTITRDVPRSLNRQVITIGRSESNDIVLPETSITRQHAQLERTATGWQVRDLGSQNGTFLDGKPLLPDIPEPWESYQTLRIGPYFMQLQMGKGYEFKRLPFSASALPDELELRAGQTAALQVAVRNDSPNVDEFTVAVERLPAGWVTVSGQPLRLRPDEQKTVKVTLHPPLAPDILLGTHRYLVVVRSQTLEKERIAIPGTVEVLPAEEGFSLNLWPQAVVGKGNVELQVRNEGLVDKSFALTSTNSENRVRFGVWRLKETAVAAAPSAPARKKPLPASVRRISSRIPILQRLRTAPKMAFSRLQTAPRQALNRVLPGLGSLVPAINLPTSIGSPAASSARPSSAPAPPAKIDRRKYEEIIFPSALNLQLAVPAGQEERVRLSVAPRKRPLWGRRNQTLPYDLAVADRYGRGQTVSGHIEVKPRLRSSLLAIILLVLILFACSLATYGLLNRYQPAVPAAVISDNDRDGDGLSNLAEVYLHQTDPNNSDGDHDTLPDGEEIEAGLNPRLADTDGDGLEDALEIRLNTNPRLADTDGDLLADGLEVQVLNTDPLNANTLPIRPTPSNTPTPPPSATPSPVPGPTGTAVLALPATSEQTLVSLAGQDGHVIQEAGTGRLTVFDGPEIQVGEGETDARQYKGFLSFDTSAIPAGAVIETAVLRLTFSDRSGTITNLGPLQVDMAPYAGFGASANLENDDFSANATVFRIATLSGLEASGQVEGSLDESGLQLLNRQGATQFRLYFTLPNDSDGVEDWVRFWAGEAPDESVRPQLLVVYRVGP